MAELISSSRVAEITGFTSRWVQKKAAAGKIPGAKHFGGHWRFDEAKVRLWINASDPRDGWQPPIKEAKSGGEDSNTKARSSANRLKQLLERVP